MPVCVTIRMVTIGKLIVIVTARARSAHRAPRDNIGSVSAGLSRGIPYPISGHAYNKAPIYHNHDTFLWAEPMQNRPSTPSDAASALLSGSATIRPQCRGVCLHAIASTAASHGGS